MPLLRMQGCSYQRYRMFLNNINRSVFDIRQRKWRLETNESQLYAHRSRSRARIAFGTVTNGAGAEHHVPNHSHLITHRRETPHFWWATRRGLKAMFACPRAQALLPLPGPSRALAPKPPFFRVSSGRTSRSSPTSSAPIQTRTTLPQSRYPSATRRGRVPSIAARCGHRSCIECRSPPAPTRVARIPARLPASYWRQLVRNRGQRAVNPEQNHLHPTLKHQRGICPRRRLLHRRRCG